MPRNKRVDSPGAWHHVMNRGLSKRTVFENRTDMRYFMSRVAYAVRRHEIEVHCFCLMMTHFHLLVRSPRGLLSTGMGRIENEYVRYFNRGRRRDGSLFRGRFLSKPVGSEVYRRILIRYIDYNPVKGGVVKSPAEYPHGSAGLLSGNRIPPWLATWWLRGEVSGLTRKGLPFSQALERAFHQLDAAREHILLRRMESSSFGSDPLDDLVKASHEAVQEWMRIKAHKADRTRPGFPILGPSSVAAACAEAREKNPRWDAFPGRQRVDAWAVAKAYILREFCALSFAEIARRLDISKGTASRRYAEHVSLMMSNPVYAERVGRIVRKSLDLCHEI